MIEIQTKQNTVKILADRIDKPTKQQILATARDPAYAHSKIRIMPDTHAGRGCVIGMTMTLQGRVSPSLVGVDIGCGMEIVRLQDTEIDLARLDSFILKNIPTGKASFPEKQVTDLNLNRLCCVRSIDSECILRSLGTLGGGNHFIELDRGRDGVLYLVIHSGSRSLGASVANFYRDEAYKHHLKKARHTRRAEIRDSMDQEELLDLSRYGFNAHGDDLGSDIRVGRTKAVKRDDRQRLDVKWETAVCEGELFESYLEDMALTVAFAEENRKRIAESICKGLELRIEERFSCVHNYIDEDRILRKGAISARQGERVLIPLNMRDGAILAIGKGNPEWNFSAPHGAGRACSRTDARHAYDVETYQNEMRKAGVYTTTATKETLDECPMAYKSPERILPYLEECATDTDHLKPIYNFKATES